MNNEHQKEGAEGKGDLATYMLFLLWVELCLPKRRAEILTQVL